MTDVGAGKGAAVEAVGVPGAETVPTSPPPPPPPQPARATQRLVKTRCVLRCEKMLCAMGDIRSESKERIVPTHRASRENQL
jgi:hypothetical protein